MDYLAGLLDGFFQNESQMRLAFIALSAMTVMALVLGLGFLITGLFDPARRRMQQLRGYGGNEGTLGSQMDSVSRLFIPKEGWRDSALYTRLVHAGYRTETAVANFTAIRVFAAVLLPAAVIIIAQYIPDLRSDQILVYAAVAFGAGIILPGYVLDKLIAKRQRLLRNGFPDALDMLVVCVESGLGLSAALQRVAEEIEISHPELAEEIALVNAEIRMGKDRMDALKGMAFRTGLEDIRGLVALLDQSVRFGTGVAETLRVYSEEFRDKRIQRAEEAAAKIGTKMIFPLTFFIWPSFFLVMVGPAILGVLAVWQGQ